MRAMDKNVPPGQVTFNREFDRLDILDVVACIISTPFELFDSHAKVVGQAWQAYKLSEMCQELRSEDPQVAQYQGLLNHQKF